MSEQLTPDIPQAEYTTEVPLPQCENIDIGGEKFKVQRGHVSDVKVIGRKDPLSVRVDMYRHLETGMSITIRDYGPNSPENHPIPIRMDYECPCMDNSSRQRMATHDCKQQRDLAQDTAADLEIGVIAFVKESTAAGNGHGPEAVYAQETIQHNAKGKDKPIPTMHEAQSQAGYFGDTRRHEVIAKVIKATIGDRVAIPMTSNTGKIQNFIEAGINVMPDTRIELVTSQTENRHLHSGRRDYDHLKGKTKPGAYLINGHPVLLTPKVYYDQFVKIPSAHPFRDRIFAPLRRLTNRTIN